MGRRKPAPLGWLSLLYVSIARQWELPLRIGGAFRQLSFFAEGLEVDNSILLSLQTKSLGVEQAESFNGVVNLIFTQWASPRGYELVANIQKICLLRKYPAVRGIHIKYF